MKEHWEKNLRLRMQGLRKEAPKGFLDEIKKEAIKEAEDMLKSGDFKVFNSLEEYKKAMDV